jgi:hypothetical protein
VSAAAAAAAAAAVAGRTECWISAGLKLQRNRFVISEIEGLLAQSAGEVVMSDTRSAVGTERGADVKCEYSG